MSGPVRLGVFGAGQLGRMLALAGAPLGVRCRFIDPHETPCAALFGEHVRAEFDDESAHKRFAEGLDVATLEFENIPTSALEAVRALVPIRPAPESLRVAQDRVLEKELFHNCNIETAPTARVDSPDDLRGAINTIGVPGILKARRGGYDGKGQARVTSIDELDEARELAEKTACVYEGVVDFDHEVSVVGVRGLDGATTFYPVGVNTHTSGILTRCDIPPASIPHPLTERGVCHTRDVMEELEHVGVLTVEYFVCGERLIANELAPRVHNTGHWTIDGAFTSQFENHLRAVLGWPLGSTELLCEEGCAMLNCIGGLPKPRDVLAHPRVCLHDYGKFPRPGRKLGHVTCLAHHQTRIDELVSIIANANRLTR